MKILIAVLDYLVSHKFLMALRSQKYIVDHIKEVSDIRNYLEAFQYDILVLDVMLENFDSFKFCKDYRSNGGETLILLVTKEGDIKAQVLGLQAGADCYVEYDAQDEEITSHVLALYRRRSQGTIAFKSCSRFFFDDQSKQFYYEGQPIVLTPKEYNILRLFINNPNQSFSPQAILDRAWPSQLDQPDVSTVKSHMRTLRKKLNHLGIEDLIQTVYGFGYRVNKDYLKSLQEA